MKHPTKPDVPLYTKPYRHLEDNYRQFDPCNTLLLDDTPEKAMFNPPYTYVCPPTFYGDPSDEFLMTQLMPYLNRLYISRFTVIKFVRDNPFP